MGCVNSSAVTIIRSMESFKKEARKNLMKKKLREFGDNDFTVYEEGEDDEEEDYNSNNYHCSLERSQIPITAKMEDNELIFL